MKRRGFPPPQLHVSDLTPPKSFSERVLCAGDFLCRPSPTRTVETGFDFLKSKSADRWACFDAFPQLIETVSKFKRL